MRRWGICNTLMEEYAVTSDTGHDEHLFFPATATISFADLTTGINSKEEIEIEAPLYAAVCGVVDGGLVRYRPTSDALAHAVLRLSKSTYCHW